MNRITPAAAAEVALEIYARPFAWGVSDCCTAPCAAFARLHGIDLMKDVRGRYCTARGAARLIRSAGGLARAARELARSAGLMASTGGPGDIGVVGDGAEAMGAFCIAPGQWAVKGVAGLVVMFHVTEAWTCPLQ